MKTILLTAHIPSPNTETLAKSCFSGLKQYGEGLNIIQKPPISTQSHDILSCDGLIIGTTENIGYMAGLTKDFFDRSYNDCLSQTDGLPVGIYIRAGLDGTATAKILTQLANALNWRMIAAPLILKGKYNTRFETEVAELGGSLAAGIASGIF